MSKILLIGGGGTLGLHAADALVQLGHHVDNVCREDHRSEDPRLRFLQADVDNDLLTEMFRSNRYDAIVDLLHYRDAVEWHENRRQLLLDNTDQLVFLSSYRVYADQDHPIRETSPQYLEVSRDRMLLTCEDYAIPKSRAERELRDSGSRNWTVVRPVISFSHLRLDLVTLQSGLLLERMRAGKQILLPAVARDITAGISWSRNIGLMIGRLVGCEAALGEDYTLGTGENLSWGDVAECYTEVFGAEFVWVDSAVYVANATPNTLLDHWTLFYDRLLDRRIDNSKMLAATGLQRHDFVSVREGLVHERDRLARQPAWAERMLSNVNRDVAARMDAWLASHPN